MLDIPDKHLLYSQMVLLTELNILLWNFVSVENVLYQINSWQCIRRLKTALW